MSETVTSPQRVEVKYTKKDFHSGEEVRWCPGCEDYAILSAVQTAFAQMNLRKEKFVVVSGIGCSSRFPYYMNTYGLHSIHGRAIPIATGLKVTNPDLAVWVVTGDGDCLSIGGNHFIHGLRRNVDLKILLFDNHIYGLTKGQYSPTSEHGKINKSAPYGTIEQPLDGVSMALSIGATFVARTAAGYVQHLISVLNQAAKHKGSAYVHIYQNCNIFNDGTFDHFTDKSVREDNNIFVEHGKPLIFGKDKNRGLKLKEGKFETVTFEPGHPPADLTVFDETNFMMGMALSKLEGYPVAQGILRRVQKPSFDEQIYQQIEAARKKVGHADLNKLITSDDTWDVK